MERSSTESFNRFSQTNKFEANYGGGEFNVAVSLVNFGLQSEFVTKLPKNELGDCALQEIRKRKVGHKNVAFGGERLGVYFLESGASVRSGNVLYDRANSSISTIGEDDLDWDKILEDADWFHWSGVTPAISENAAKQCLKAVKTAHKLGIKVSADLNYRSKLWKYGKEPKDIMPELLKYSEVVLGDLDTLFFMTGKPQIIKIQNL